MGCQLRVSASKCVGKRNSTKATTALTTIRVKVIYSPREIDQLNTKSRVWEYQKKNNVVCELVPINQQEDCVKRQIHKPKTKNKINKHHTFCQLEYTHRNPIVILTYLSSFAESTQKYWNHNHFLFHTLHTHERCVYIGIKKKREKFISQAKKKSTVFFFYLREKTLFIENNRNSSQFFTTVFYFLLRYAFHFFSRCCCELPGRARAHPT